MIHLSPMILTRISRWSVSRARDPIGSTHVLDGYFSRLANTCVADFLVGDGASCG
jgi:hypothetical protein